MLRIEGSSSRLCDRTSRRKCLQVGGLGLLGLTLADVLRAESRVTGRRRSRRSVILVWQHGGPSQLDTFDMKPHAPSEFRGPYRPISSKLPGFQISEMMPYHSRVADKCSICRAFTHRNGDHWAAAHWLLTGYTGPTGNVANRPARNPSMGSISSYLLGPRERGVPSGVNINDGGFGYHGAAYLGVAHNPFRTGDFSYGNEAGRLPTASDKDLKLTDGLSNKRVMNRNSLLEQLDELRRRVDDDRHYDQLDDINQEALSLLLSGRAYDAFDLSKEDEKTREEYGPGWGEQALLSRRLIEAGVRFVTLNTGYWDDHGNIKGALDDKLPRHDRAVGVLIDDLERRGLLEDTLVITAGEFGRTPKINGNAGRDHWPATQSILFAGGGYRHGQIIGSTDDKAAYPTSGVIRPQDFGAIIYHAIGLQPHDTIPDLSGRPTHLLPGGTVPKELLG